MTLYRRWSLVGGGCFWINNIPLYLMLVFRIFCEYVEFFHEADKCEGYCQTAKQLNVLYCSVSKWGWLSQSRGLQCKITSAPHGVVECELSLCELMRTFLFWHNDMKNRHCSMPYLIDWFFLNICPFSLVLPSKLFTKISLAQFH